MAKFVMPLDNEARLAIARGVFYGVPYIQMQAMLEMNGWPNSYNLIRKEAQYLMPIIGRYNIFQNNPFPQQLAEDAIAGLISHTNTQQQ